jgi:hypothetical protein
VGRFEGAELFLFCDCSAFLEPKLHTTSAFHASRQQSVLSGLDSEQLCEHVLYDMLSEMLEHGLASTVAIGLGREYL